MHLHTIGDSVTLDILCISAIPTVGPVNEGCALTCVASVWMVADLFLDFGKVAKVSHFQFRKFLCSRFFCFGNVRNTHTFCSASAERPAAVPGTSGRGAGLPSERPGQFSSVVRGCAVRQPPSVVSAFWSCLCVRGCAHRAGAVSA